MAQVRYIVDDVSEAVAFYVSKLGFEVEQQYGTAFAMVVRDDLTLWLAGPNASAARPMSDGAIPSPGGWSRFVLIVDDLESVVSRLTADGVGFRNDIVENFRDANRFSVGTLPVTSSSSSSLRRLSCPNRGVTLPFH